MQYKAIQGKASQGKAIQGNTRQYKAIQGNTRQYKAIQGNTRQWGDILPVIIVIFKVSHQFLYSYQDNRTNVSNTYFYKLIKKIKK